MAARQAVGQTTGSGRRCSRPGPPRTPVRCSSSWTWCPATSSLSFNNTLMLQVIFFASSSASPCSCIPGDRAGPVTAFMNGCNEVFMKMVNLVMEAAPFFVFALMAGVVAPHGRRRIRVRWWNCSGLAGYGATVVVGLAILLFPIYPVLLSLALRRNVYGRFLRAISPAQLLAFSTSSSAPPCR